MTKPPHELPIEYMNENNKIDIDIGKYTCLLCKKSFDKPASGVWFVDVVRALTVNLIGVLAIICGFINSVPAGIMLTLLYAFCWGFFIVAKKIFGKKLCPYCKSENFIKNY